MKAYLKLAVIVIILGVFALSSCDSSVDSDDEEIVLEVGMEYQGGIIAYILQSGDPGYVSGETHGLIAATADQSAGIAWITGNDGTGSPVTQTTVNGNTSTDIGTGLANSNAIIAQEYHMTSAAKICRDYAGGGYNNWFLPSKDELNKLFMNKDAVGGFAGDGYWSSSETSASTAWLQGFYDGVQDDSSKDTTYRVRAVRAF